MDPIDIFSSDSDSDIEVGPVGSDVSVIPRKLPNWASTSGSNSTSKGYGSPSQNHPMTAGTSSIEGHTDQSDHAWANNQWYQSPNGNETTSAVLTKNDPKLAASSKDASQQLNGLCSKDIVDLNLAKMSENDLGRFSSEQVPRRMLPSSLQPSSSISKGKSSLENGSVGRISNAYDKPYNYMGTTITDPKSYAKDHLGRENSEVLMYGHNEGRLLPPSLVHGKSLANLQSVGSSDPVHRSGLEDRPAENDERLIFQAALENLAQPKLEATLPDGLLEVSLLRHQKIALAWMFQKETKSLHCLGGILADDQGLGKTISMIALILLQSHLKLKSVRDDLQTTKAEALNLDDDDEDISELSKGKQDGESDEVKKIPKVTTSMPTFHKGRPAAGTLVVCPASVLRQWARELDEKVTANAKLSVLIYHGGARTKDPVELAKYDVVLTTYSIVTNEVPKQPLVDEDDDEDPTNGEGFGLSSEFSVNKKRKKASNASKKGKKGKKRSNNSSIDCDSGPLARVGWFRVVLDEAQTIKNHRTQVARACCGLRAKRRWCLSGTPIQNTIDDLYSYFRFLKYDPYAVFKSFCSSIKYPISRNTINGYKKLQAVLKTIMLRRTKETLIDGEPIVNLPPKSTYLKKVEFSSEERTFYSKLEAESRLQFKAYAAAGTVRQNYANILLMLLRLRQACDHPLLVKGYNYDSAGRASLQMARGLPRDMLINLVNLLEASLAICGVCNDPPEDAVVTMCGHVFCYQCVSDYLTGDDNICPAPECKEQLGEDIVFSKATLRSCLSGEFDGNGASSSEIAESSLALKNVFGSCKIKAALEILEKYCKLSERPNIEGCSDISFSSEPTISQRVDFNVSTDTTPPGGPIKALIFSQWTGMLDLVETSLNYSCIQYRRFDGTMSLASRDRAVKDFNNDPEVTVMLMSLKAGNLGLNLVAACHVILLDLWWNPTTEDQAIDRAHRIGQTRPVTVSRITVKDTVEDRILALQEEKRKMVASAFGEDQKGGSAARLTVEDLRYLFMV